MRHLILGAAVAAACAAAPAAAKEARTRKPEVLVEQLILNPDNMAETRVGRLTWLNGVRLWSKHWLFGGFSSLDISPDGSRLLTASDRGTWWTASLKLKDGIPEAIGANALIDMPDAQGQTLAESDQDSEGMATSATGTVYVSFERHHRIVRYTAPDPADITSLRRAPPETLPSPPDLAHAPNNAGLEALALMADGTLFALTESYQAEPGYNRGWLVRDQNWAPFEYKRTEPYDVTDAKQLPDGDMLVLERRFSMLGGLGARLCVISGATIKPGARLECRTVAELQPPQPIDNMEGLAVRQNEKGETIVYLISDDNFSRLQRTVLLVFRLEPEAATGH
ncbi:esterase-like activity of phytase family protein [Emcibacter sp. SYSU 3D8]|uniref:esterase-like activity of phytase family protein n=1 Tax=Emcibacter sp. SYSU 3D8 TaxID=3133969 RepID=UPI0031FED4BA